MRWSKSVRSAVLLGPVLAFACPVFLGSAQQLIGYVPKRDATVTGSSDELDGQAVLAGSASVTAKDHTASIKLTRGGNVNVCQTSELKITESREVSVAAPLLFSLDRGSIELETTATPSDSIMTPDLRFTVRNSGPLDLRMRVAGNGDTCVENRGATAPTLAVTDAFGESMYELSAGQHVLFERGSVREMVDHETAPCGCPEKGDTIAEALLAPGSATAGGQGEPATPAAVQHPFPMAQSAGLQPQAEAAAEPAPPPPPGAPQISDTLSYTAGMKDPDELRRQAAKAASVTAPPATPLSTASVANNSAIAAAPTPVAPAAPKIAPKPAQQPPVNDVVHIVARVWRKLFGSH